MKGKYTGILRDGDVRRWYENMARGSTITADVNLRRLRLFCEQHGLAPKGLAALGRKNRKRLEDLVQDHVTEMEKQGKAPSYIEGVLKGVKSWLAHSDVELKRRIKVRDSSATPSIAEERVPSKDELKAILLHGSERARVSSVLMAMAGLRPQTLGNESATDGLTMGDLPEMTFHNGHVEFTKVPTMVVVRSTLSKVRHRYFTFLPAEGCEYLAAYLNKRLASGEALTGRTPVIAVAPGYQLHGHGYPKESRFITTKNVCRDIREAMRPRFRWRPYVLRAYFDTQLLLAESHGRVAHPYSAFFMGHKGDIEARYTTNKGRLPEDLIEDMRRSFRECEPYLTTTAQQLEKSSVVKEAKLEAVRSIAKNMFNIDIIEFKTARESELQRELTPDEEIEFLENEMKKAREGKQDPQKIVSEGELESHLKDGWQFVSVLPSQRILVRK